MTFDFKDANGVTFWSDLHTTLHADDKGWATIANFDEAGESVVTHPFENEVIQIAMDGSQRIRRLLHHRSHVNQQGAGTDGYWVMPKLTISRDGRFIAFTSNWGNSGRYDLFIARIVPPSSPSPSSIKINFQPASASVPSGYLADTGLVYGDRGNGYSYGWDVDGTSTARERNSANSPDKRYDTLNHMNYGGGNIWEIGVPNGTYTVHLVAGDPDYFSSVYKINVEGVLTVDGTPTSTTHWIEGTQTVTVSDGKLTVSSAAGSNVNKICFIEITPN